MSQGMVSGKVCRFCGEDCSARPRVKEADTGRYACKSCAEQAAAQAAQQAAARATVAQRARAARVASAPAAAAPTFDPDAGARVCTNCGSTVAASAAKCGGCGFDFVTGKAPGMVEAKPAPRPKASSLGRSGSASGRSGKSGKRWASGDVGMDPISKHPWISTLVGVVAILGFGFAAANAADPSLFGVLWMSAAGLALVLWVASIVCAFRDDTPGWGAVNILGGIIPGVALATVYWLMLVNQRPLLRVLWVWMMTAAVSTGVIFRMRAEGGL